MSASIIQDSYTKTLCLAQKLGKSTGKLFLLIFPVDFPSTWHKKWRCWFNQHRGSRGTSTARLRLGVASKTPVISGEFRRKGTWKWPAIAMVNAQLLPSLMQCKYYTIYIYIYRMDHIIYIYIHIYIYIYTCIYINSGTMWCLHNPSWKLVDKPHNYSCNET